MTACIIRLLYLLLYDKVKSPAHQKTLVLLPHYTKHCNKKNTITQVKEDTVFLIEMPSKKCVLHTLVFSLSPSLPLSLHSCKHKETPCQPTSPINNCRLLLAILSFLKCWIMHRSRAFLHIPDHPIQSDTYKAGVHKFSTLTHTGTHAHTHRFSQVLKNSDDGRECDSALS